MAEQKEAYQEWDAIFQEREKYLEEHPQAKDIKRPKTFKDQDGNIRCTKCGSTNDIGGCIECTTEQEFLKEHN